MNYGEESFQLFMDIKFYEYYMAKIDKGEEPTDEDFLKSVQTLNYGRELLDRKLVKFFSSAKSTNLRIRKALILVMLKVDKHYSHIKGPNFDAHLKEQVRIVCEN